jgi:uncharacterized protein (UPF0276 family)
MLLAPAGHGVGLRHEHYAHLLEHGPSGVDWMEAISENFFAQGGRPWAVLERVRRDVPIVLHGVSMALGNVGRVSNDYLAKLQQVIDRIEPAVVSDHLCWGGFGGHHSHDLLPLPYNEEALDHMVEQVERVQDKLERRILLENASSYVRFRASTISEWDFLNELCRRADCGILLDLNNVFVSSQNHGFDPRAYLDGIDADRVGQLHLAGHSHIESEHGDFLLDSHIGPVPSTVWDLYRYAIARFGTRSTLVEWDSEVPSFEKVVAESRQAAAIAAQQAARQEKSHAA